MAFSTGRSYGTAPAGPRGTARADALVVTLIAATSLLVVLGAVRLDEPPLLVGAAVLAGPAATIAVHSMLGVRRRRASALAEALAEAQERMELLFTASPEPMYVVEPGSLQFLDVNDAALRAYGFDREEFLALSVDDLRIDRDEAALQAMAADLPQTIAYMGEAQHRRKDGSTLWVGLTTQPIRYEGRPAVMTVAHDITALRESEARTRAIVDNAADAILTVDLDGRIESMNPAAQRMFGYAGELVRGQPVTRLLDAPHAALTRQASGATVIDLRTEVPVGEEVTGRRADGSTFPLELNVTQVELGDRTISTLVARDITERKAFEERLTHQGTHDPLTGLPNRVLFLDRLTHALAASERSGNRVAVLFCDVDRFKVVNDSLGHPAGDQLLLAVAQRFRAALRTSDTVARFGGDEFAVLVEELTEGYDAVTVAGKLADALREPVHIDGHEVHVSTSVGIAVGGGEGVTPEDLLRDADVAMYRAKANGRNRHDVFDDELREQAVERLRTEGALRRGMGLRQFCVHYQPEYDLASGRVVGVEALVRWEHPEEGIVAPARFLPVAEETGLIVPIGEDVLTQACVEASEWHRALGADAPVLWVNVAARQLTSRDFLDLVAKEIDQWLPGPHALGIEVTETELVPDDERTAAVITGLRDMGVRIAIDDFGTGFASLSYLWRIPADVVKIDQSFVRRLGVERDATVLVKAMIDMSHSLGKTSVAEGVETPEQRARLERLGCDTAQGYLLARPQPAEELTRLLTTALRA